MKYTKLLAFMLILAIMTMFIVAPVQAGSIKPIEKCLLSLDATIQPQSTNTRIVADIGYINLQIMRYNHVSFRGYDVCVIDTRYTWQDPEYSYRFFIKKSSEIIDWLETNFQ